MRTVITLLLIVLAQLSATDPLLKSEKKANSLIISSALVPGFGELKLGENRRAKFFGGIELGLWLTVIESNAVMHRSRSKMVSYAAVHADADLDGKEHQFAVDVANYMSFDEFNEEQQRRRLPSRVYPAEGYDWMWTSEDHREHYWTFLRSRALAEKITLFAVGGMIVNRISSAIDVSYLTKLKDSELSLNFRPLSGEVASAGAEMVIPLPF